MTEMMWALRLKSLGGPDSLEFVSVPAPTGGPNQVVIEVHAAGVGFPDLLMTRGQYQMRPDAPFIPGIEVAGIVRSAPGDAAVKPGDRVFANASLGGWAEVAVANPWVVFPIPDGMTFEQATSMVNYQTAVFAFVERGGLKSGETVLIHGAAGGTGTAAIEVARGYGAKVIAVARGYDKLRAAKELGAEHCVEAEGDWLGEVKRITDNRGVDVVYDPVGGDLAERVQAAEAARRVDEGHSVRYASVAWAVPVPAAPSLSIRRRWRGRGPRLREPAASRLRQDRRAGAETIPPIALRRDDDRAAHPSAGQGCALGVVDDAGRGGVCVVDCGGERRQFATGARRFARTRNGRAAGAGRRALAHRAAIADRKPDAGSAPAPRHRR